MALPTRLTPVSSSGKARTHGCVAASLYLRDRKPCFAVHSVLKLTVQLGFTSGAGDILASSCPVRPCKRRWGCALSALFTLPPSSSRFAVGLPQDVHNKFQTPPTKRGRTCRREYARRCAGTGSTDSGRSCGRAHMARPRGGAPGGAGAPQLLRAGAGRCARCVCCKRRQAPFAWLTAQPEHASHASTGDLQMLLEQRRVHANLNPSGCVARAQATRRRMLRRPRCMLPRGSWTLAPCAAGLIISRRAHHHGPCEKNILFIWRCGSIRVPCASILHAGMAATVPYTM